MPPTGFKHTQAIFVGSVIFVILAIGFVSLLGSTASQAPATDTRAKAGVTATLKLSGVVTSVDDTKGVILVDQLQFMDAEGGKTLGTWTVTPPPGFNLASMAIGTKVTLTVNPTTFLATSHTLTATQIKVER